AAAAAPAALSHEPRLTPLQDPTEPVAAARVTDHGAGRHGQDQVVARLPRHVLALTVDAALGVPVGAVPIVEQGREVGVGAHVHAAALPAVTAVGPAFGDELFAAKAAGASPA